MDPTIVLSKTDTARLLLAQRDADLARALRSFLILVDGQRTLAQLKPFMDALGVTLDAVHHLIAEGLLHLRQDVANVGRRSSARGAEVSAPAPEVVPEPARTPAAVEADIPRSLHAAKFYGLNLVTLMLGGQDEEPRRAVRQVTTPQQLADWLAMCQALILDVSGAERAQVFVRKMWAVLPDDVRERLDQAWRNDAA
jgi:hypothetical protein